MGSRKSPEERDTDEEEERRRNDWEADEDDRHAQQAELPAPVFQWAAGADKMNLEPECLVIGFHGAAAGVLDAWTPNRKLIASLLLPELPLRVSIKKFDPQSTEGSLYLLPGEASDSSSSFTGTEICVFICQYDVPAERAYQWALSLFTHVKAKKVVVIDTILEHSYQTISRQRPSPPFLRSLHSAAETKVGLCPRLESPNFIQKAPAAILTRCHISSIPCTVYLSLEEENDFSVETLRAFDRVITAHVGLKDGGAQIATKYAAITAKPFWKKHNSMYM